MPIATLRSVGLYYESHGPETAPAIVFAHGWGGSHLSWFQQVPAFMDRYRCVTFDHRSWGQSRATDDRAGEAFVDDLLELLDHLEIAPATFVAQSMGGWTCLNLALAAPSRVDRLLMADSPGGLSSETISAVWRAAQAEVRPPLPEGVHIAAGPTMASEQPSLSFLYAQLDSLNPPRDPSTQMTFLATVGQSDVASLPFPVLFVGGPSHSRRSARSRGRMLYGGPCGASSADRSFRLLRAPRMVQRNSGRVPGHRMIPRPFSRRRPRRSSRSRRQSRSAAWPFPRQNEHAGPLRRTPQRRDRLRRL